MKHKLKFKCEDRNYTSWTVYSSDTLYELDKTTFNIDPIKSKLFNQDIFEYDDATQEIFMLHSSNREMPVIPGILVLENKQIYGLYKDKYYYRFIPDDKRLPYFIVPYKDKQVGFSKHQVNKYAVMRFESWTVSQKHPIGKLVHVIGEVDQLINFYEYQLYCKSLYASIQSFTKQTITKLRETSEQTIIDKIKSTYKLEDRQHLYTFTIDSKGCKDFDDAISIQIHEDETATISIYIANVSIWLDVMNLWDSFSNRIATIYLPDRKRPMMPTILSDCLCSLVENNTRFAFTLDIDVTNSGEVLKYSYCNSIIRVDKNHVYETPELFNQSEYIILLSYLKKMNKIVKYIPVVKDSHHVICYLMVLMNYLSAKKFIAYKNGIFRSVKLNNLPEFREDLPSNVIDFIKMWNSSAGIYLKYNERDTHDTLAFDAYVHITSPIRRLVDILNLLDMQNNIGLLPYNESSKAFYDRWTKQSSIDYINTSMRSIRRVQRDCELLTMYMNNPTLLEKTYAGYVFDKICRNDKLYQYMVYLPEMKLVSKLTTRIEMDEYDECKFKLFLFKDEANMTQKIKLNLLETIDNNDIVESVQIEQ